MPYGNNNRYNLVPDVIWETLKSDSNTNLETIKLTFSLNSSYGIDDEIFDFNSDFISIQFIKDIQQQFSQVKITFSPTRNNFVEEDEAFIDLLKKFAENVTSRVRDTVLVKYNQYKKINQLGYNSPSVSRSQANQHYNPGPGFSH